MDFFAGEFLGFVLILTRLSAFLGTAPLFSWMAIPVRIKVVIAMLTSIFFAMITPSSASASSILVVIVLLANEVVYGIALGLATTLLYSAVKISARIAERQMGMAMAEIMDPFTGERSQPLGMFMEIVFIMLLLSYNAHHIFLLTVSKSFQAFPPGSIPSIAMLTKGIILCGSTMLLTAFKIGLPVLAVFMVLTVILGIMARIAPEMNIFFLSFPLMIGLGLLMVVYFMPYLNSFVREFAEWLSKLLPL